MVHRRVSWLFILLALTVTSSAQAQSGTLRGKLDQLFVFGSGGQQLFLAGSAGAEATEVHGAHFIPDQVESNGVLLSVLGGSLASSIASFPLPSTAASQTFRFVDGVPTPTSNTFGSIYAERAQTIGKGRINAGLTFSAQNYSSLRGVRTDGLQFSFLHVNVDFPNCDVIFQGDCEEFGTPTFESDVIALSLDLDVSSTVYAFYSTFGITDWFDVSVAVPIVNVDMVGFSRAQVEVAGSSQADHFFGGTPANPRLFATSQSRGSATGLGDVAVRLKARVTNNDVWNLGILGDLRAPTGNEEDFLGTGSVNVRGILIVAGEYSDFSPHLNAGFEYRGSDFERNEIELIAGFDYLMADWVTIVVDMLSSFRMGENPALFPDPVTLHTPFDRTVARTNIPNMRDNIVDGSLGFKFRTSGGLVIITNMLVSLNKGGLRSNVAPTLGVEYLF